MDSTERLQSLKEWAETKKWVQPGESGTLPTGSIGGIKGLVVGGSRRSAVSFSQSSDRYGGQYEAPVGPPSYEVATGHSWKKEKGALGRWLEKRKARKAAKRNGSLPEYVP